MGHFRLFGYEMTSERSLMFTGLGFLTLEVLWAMAWFGIMIWFNLDPAALPYEQTFFDHILHSLMIGMLATIVISLYHSEHISYIWFWVILVAGFTDSRGILKAFRHNPEGTPYAYAYIVMSIAALIFTFLALVWFMALLRWQYRKEFPKHHHHGHHHGRHQKHESSSNPLLEVVEEGFENTKRVVDRLKPRITL